MKGSEGVIRNCIVYGNEAAHETNKNIYSTAAEGVTYGRMNGAWKTTRGNNEHEAECNGIRHTADEWRLLFRRVVAGRQIGADKSAYGTIRVMMNCNQTGEAGRCRVLRCAERRRGCVCQERRPMC